MWTSFMERGGLALMSRNSCIFLQHLFIELSSHSFLWEAGWFFSQGFVGCMWMKNFVLRNLTIMIIIVAHESWHLYAFGDCFLACLDWGFYFYILIYISRLTPKKVDPIFIVFAALVSKFVQPLTNVLAPLVIWVPLVIRPGMS